MSLCIPLRFLRPGASCFQSIARKFSADKDEKPRVLITGGLGQLGSGLARIMRQRYGSQNVLLSDIIQPTPQILSEGPFVYADVLDLKHLNSIVVNNHINWVIHFSALLSAVAEDYPQKALDVNLNGFHNIAKVCINHGLRLFSPSTIGAFGPESPKDKCPDVTIMRPKTMYGITKIHMELLGEYYHTKYNLDYRSLRFPGVIGADTAPGGGTTDYAVHIFHDVARKGQYECFLRKDTRLPMIYIQDCLESVVKFMEQPQDNLKLRTYNVTATSFTPDELVNEMKKYFPNMEVTYKPDKRQDIADTWPQVMDDSRARADWGWNHTYDLPELTKVMIDKITEQINNKKQT